MHNGKVYWIIGASEGLGREISYALYRCGAKLVLSARNADRLADLAEELPGSRYVALDVRDPDAVRKGALEAGDIDGVVYCAGEYFPLSARAWTPDEAEAMCDVNFMGTVRVLGQTVPGFVRRNAGHLVIIGSLAGLSAMPNVIGYGSSKAGLRHLAKCLHIDLMGTGIKVQLINPGFITTRLTAKNTFKMPLIMTAEAAAERVLRAMRSNRFETNFPRSLSLLVKASGLLPHRFVWRKTVLSRRRTKE